MKDSLTMKTLPVSEQPYEKFQRYGAVVLSDAELLAIILRSGGKQCSALQLAQEVLCQKHYNLLNLEDLSLEELQQISGIGQVKAVQLKAIAELSKRLTATCYEKKLQVTEPKILAAYYMEQLRHQRKEQLILAMFDTKQHFLGDQVISIGTINASLVSPREIFQCALSHKAVHIILLHNHPSGDPTPSKEDIRVTKMIESGGNLLGIYLADHIVIGDKCFVSMREQGILQERNE